MDLPDLSYWLAPEHLLHTSGGGIIVLFVLFAFVKGIAKQLLNMLCLALGFGVGYGVFLTAPTSLGKWFGVLPPNALMILSVVAGGATYWLARGFLQRLVTPGLGAPQTGGHRLGSAGLSLIPACFLLWVVAMAIRWTGVMAQMKFLDEGLRADKRSLFETLPLFAQLQHSLTTGTVGGLLNHTDPIASTEAGALCSLLLMQRDADSWQRLHTDPAAAAILRHPTVQRLIHDKDWTKPASYQSYAQLLTLPELHTALQDGKLAAQLRALNVEQQVRAATGMIPAA